MVLQAVLYFSAVLVAMPVCRRGWQGGDSATACAWVGAGAGWGGGAAKVDARRSLVHRAIAARCFARTPGGRTPVLSARRVLRRASALARQLAFLRNPTAVHVVPRFSRRGFGAGFGRGSSLAMFALRAFRVACAVAWLVRRGGDPPVRRVTSPCARLRFTRFRASRSLWLRVIAAPSAAPRREWRQDVAGWGLCHGACVRVRVLCGQAGVTT